LSNSVINEEGEEVEEVEEGEEEDDDEKATSRSRSNPDLEETEPEIEPELAEVKPGNSIPTDAASKRVEQDGYNLLDQHEDNAELEPETSSSCSSDLSFGQSSSGNHLSSRSHFYPVNLREGNISSLIVNLCSYYRVPN